MAASHGQAQQSGARNLRWISIRGKNVWVFRRILNRKRGIENVGGQIQGYALAGALEVPQYTRFEYEIFGTLHLHKRELPQKTFKF